MGNIDWQHEAHAQAPIRAGAHRLRLMCRLLPMSNAQNQGDVLVSVHVTTSLLNRRRYKTRNAVQKKVHNR